LSEVDDNENSVENQGVRASCDELRGGMDATQYKDYVLFMLFIK